VIDQNVFDAIMGAFAERLGKPLGETASVMYYAALSEELTTDEFQRAARVVFKQHRFNTWPAAADFLDAARGNVTAPAIEQDRFAAGVAADVVLREATWPNGRTWPQVAADIERYAGPAAVAAFYAVGGPARFRDLLEADVRWLRKELVEVYPSAATYVRRAVANDPTLADLPPAAREMILAAAAETALPRAIQDRQALADAARAKARQLLARPATTAQEG
jgi:hypothetical protein